MLRRVFKKGLVIRRCIKESVYRRLNVPPQSKNGQAAYIVLLGYYNHIINTKIYRYMAVNQKAISAKIDITILEKLDYWCQANKVKRNTAINMAIDSLLQNGIPKRWR